MTSVYIHDDDKKLSVKTYIQSLWRMPQGYYFGDIRAFLTYGVLLGAYSEHNFISYDPDIDLGILAKEVSGKLHKKMRSAGFILYRQNIISDT